MPDHPGKICACHPFGVAAARFLVLLPGQESQLVLDDALLSVADVATELSQPFDWIVSTHDLANLLQNFASLGLHAEKIATALLLPGRSCPLGMLR